MADDLDTLEKNTGVGQNGEHDDLSNEPEKQVSPEQLQDMEDNYNDKGNYAKTGGDDTLGKGYVGTDGSIKVSKGFWNRKKAGFAGGIAGVLGLAGIFGPMVIGPFEAVHLSQNLMHAFTKTQSDSDSRSNHLLRYARAWKTGELGYTRVGVIGAAVANKAIDSMSDSGIKLAGSSEDFLQGRPQRLEIDKSSMAKSHPEVKNMSDGEFKNWLNDTYRDYGLDFTGSGNDFQANIGGKKTSELGGIIKTTSGNIVGDGTVVSAIKTRSLKLFYGLDSLFHPFSRALSDKIAAKKAEIKKNNPKESDGQAEQEAIKEATEASIDGDVANTPAVQSGESAAKDVQDSANTRKAVNYVSLGTMGIWTLGCGLKEAGPKLVEINHTLTALPAALYALRFIADGQAVMTGNDSEIDMDQLGADMDSLNSGGDWSGSAPMSALSDGTVQKDENGNVVGDLPDSYKQAFEENDSTTAGTISDVGDKILKYSFGVGYIPGICSSTAGFIAAGLLAAGQIVTAVLTAPEGGAGEAGIQVAARTIEDAVTGAVGSTVAGKVTARFETILLKKLATPEVTMSLLRGPLGGSLLAFGAREAANMSAIASGGIAATKATETVVGAVGMADQQQFEQESTVAKLFDTHDDRSLVSRVALSISPSFTTNIKSLASFIQNIPSVLASSFGSIFTHASAAQTTTSWSGNYDWGFPQYGIPDSMLNDPNLADPYDNLNKVGQFLMDKCNTASTDSSGNTVYTYGAGQGECANSGSDAGGGNFASRIKACFGNTLSYSAEGETVPAGSGPTGQWDVSPTPNTDVDPNSDEYQQANCSDGITQTSVTDLDWARLVMFVNDANNIKAMDCADGTSDTSSQSCSDEGALPADTTASDTGSASSSGAGSSFRIASFNICYGDNDRPAGQKCNTLATTGNTAADRFSQSKQEIINNNLDVVGIQEARNDQVGWLSSIPGYGICKGSGYASQNPIIFNSSKFSLVNCKTIAGYQVLGSQDNQANTQVELKDKSTGQQFYVINEHEPVNSGSARTDSANARAAYISNLSKDGLPIFLTGDMNSAHKDNGISGVQSGLPYCILTSPDTSLSDAFDVVKNKSGQCPSNNNSSTSGSGVTDGGHVDHIYMSISVTATNYTYKDRLSNGSDHNTLFVDVSIPAGGA